MALKDVNCERTDNVPYVSIIEITTTGRKASSTTDGVGQSVPIDSGEHRHWYHCDEVKRLLNDARATASRENRFPREARISEQGARGSAISDIQVAEIVDIIPDRWHVRY